MKTFDLISLGNAKVRPLLRTGIALAFAGMFISATVYALPQAPVDLGVAGGFSILSGAAITDVSGTTIDGDVGASPITGAAIGLTAGQVNGIIYAVDGFGPTGSVEDPGLLTDAKNDLTTAYNDAAGRILPTLIVGGELGTLILPPGLYKDDGAPASLTLTGTLILDALGDPNAVWIFQSESTLSAEVDSEVVLANGADACNVFWQVGSDATLKTRAIFKGTIMADQSITMQNQATLEGRALARIAGIAMDANTAGFAPCGPSFLVGVPADTNAPCDDIPAPATVVAAEACSTQTTFAVLSESILDGTCPTIYIIRRVWTATNECGGSISATQFISIVDLSIPEITCPTSPIVVLSDTNCVGTVPDLRALAEVSDTCGTNGLVVTQNPPGGTLFFLQTNVTLTVTDQCGNSNSCIVSIVSPCEEGFSPFFSVEKSLTNIYFQAGTTNQRPPIVGEAVTFVITIVNTGDVALVSIPVVDTYDPLQLQYVNAVPPSDDNIDDGVINWADVGPLAIGSSTSIVVNFIAVCAGSGTNTVLVSPVPGGESDPVPPLLVTALYDIMSGPLSGNVWIDLNGNGIIDENLAVQGLNGVTVRLYELLPGATNLVNQAVTATINGQRGAYSFANLPPGTYRVVVDSTTVPATLNVNTTPLHVQLASTLCGVFPGANFGFMSATPTAVDLIDFTAHADGGRVSLTWQTLTEWNNAGYNLYRATSPDGTRTRINTGLIPGSADGTGRHYVYVDPDHLSDGEYYYWLEDVEYDGSVRINGPVRVRVGQVLPGDTLIGSSSIGGPGLYMINADTFRRSGIHPSTVDAARFRVFVDQAEVASYVTTESATFSDWDYVLFYVNEGTQVSFGYAEGTPPRMAYRFVFVEYGDGDVWTGNLADNAANIQVVLRPDYIRYLITGFHESTIWLLDITNPQWPILLIGADIVRVNDEVGLYFSYGEVDSGIIYAAGDSAVIRIESISHKPSRSAAASSRVKIPEPSRVLPSHQGKR